MALLWSSVLRVAFLRPCAVDVARCSRRNDPSVARSLIATARRGNAPACWAPSELSYRKGDERVQRGMTKRALRAPKRTLAEYSPVVPRGDTPRPAAAGQEARRPHVRPCASSPFETLRLFKAVSSDVLRSHGIRPRSSLRRQWMLSHRERTAAAHVRPHV